MHQSTSRPRVSVIVPVWNAEKYIAVTLHSIRQQDFKDIEVLVVDDCSTDGSPEIIAGFVNSDARFSYHKSPVNFGGPAGPRNMGLDLARGDLVAFCDADDIWVPHKLALQVATIDLTKAEMVCSMVCDFHDDTKLPKFLAPEQAPSYSLINSVQLRIKNWIALSSVLVRKDALNAVGRFNAERSYVAVEDYDMWMRLSRNGNKILRLSCPLVHYRKLPTSISADKLMMIRRALNVIGSDYEARGLGRLFAIIRPVHWALYVTSSAWMRAVRREL
jgi:teichuronic acid biosynthesis glycosyltransferase TuaG